MRWRIGLAALAFVPAIATAQSMKDMPDMQGMDHSTMDDTHDTHDMHDMKMGPMQGGSPASDARSGDWSEGVAPMSMHDMHAMDMDDTSSTSMLLLDNLESYAGQGAHGQSWEAEGWYGNDRDRLRVRSEGDRSGGRPQDGDVEVFWSHAVATFWDTQIGVRRDIGAGPKRNWAAFGVQGLAPYWFEVEATAYAGQGGRTAGRLRVEYELLLTQRLILQPEVELNAYGKDDTARGIRSGISGIEGGLRLRYEIRRSIAPYIGIAWEHLAGGTADLAADRGQRITDRRWVAGIRLWL